MTVSTPCASVAPTPVSTTYGEVHATATEHDVEIERERTSRTISRTHLGVVVVRRAGWVIPICFALWVALRIAEISSGVELNLSATLEAAIDLSVGKALWGLATALVGAAYMNRRRLHRRDVAEKSRDIRKYEQIIDPNSTRSGLTDEETAPRDWKH